MKKHIAHRDLLYCSKNTDERKQLFVQIGEPYLLTPGMVSFEYTEGTAGCTVRLDGLADEIVSETYGADTLQALELAIKDVDSILNRLRSDYEFFFPNGEPYFEHE